MSLISDKAYFMDKNEKNSFKNDKIIIDYKDFNDVNKIESKLFNKKTKRQHQENSLDELTKEFVEYVNEAESEIIDLNDVVKKLRVKKRRIYDITNVLEGKLYIIL